MQCVHHAQTQHQTTLYVLNSCSNFLLLRSILWTDRSNFFTALSSFSSWTFFWCTLSFSSISSWSCIFICSSYRIFGIIENKGYNSCYKWESQCKYANWKYWTNQICIYIYMHFRWTYKQYVDEKPEVLHYKLLIENAKHDSVMRVFIFKAEDLLKQWWKCRYTTRKTMETTTARNTLLKKTTMPILNWF